MKISTVEIQFPVPIETPDNWERRLHDLVHEVCEKYEAANPGRVMWPAGYGSKITYMPMTQEEEKARGMEFNDSVYAIEVSEREGHPKELARREKRRAENEPANVADANKCGTCGGSGHIGHPHGWAICPDCLRR